MSTTAPKKSASSTSALNTAVRLDLNDINRQSRYWCFTVNNYVRQYSEMPKGVSYLVSGEEVGEEGTPHLQCYVELERGQRRSFVAKAFPGAAKVAARYATAYNASQYCKKEGKFVEFGVLSTLVKNQGKRNDLQEVAEKLYQGVDIKDIQQEHMTTYMRNYRGIQHLRNAIHVPAVHRPNLKVHLFIGKTRLGKSHYARVTLGAWPKPVGKGLWFDGYDRQKTVVIDEFRGQFPLSDVLQITDPYQVAVETKGGHTWFEPDLLIFTTNTNPMNMYVDHDSDSREAFFARFNEVYWWYAKYQFMVLNEQQRKNLFDAGEYPLVPNTATPTIRPFCLDGAQPPAPKLKRSRASLNLAKEVADAEKGTPLRRFDLSSGKLRRPLKQLKVTATVVPETQPHCSPPTQVIDLVCSEEFTQPTQVIDGDDVSISDESAAISTLNSWQQETQPEQDWPDEQEWPSDEDLFGGESGSELCSESSSTSDEEGYDD